MAFQDNPLYRGYERFRLTWMTEEGIYLDALIDRLASALDSYCAELRGNPYQQPHDSLKDVWDDFNYNFADPGRDVFLSQPYIAKGRSVKLLWMPLKAFIEEVWADFGDVCIDDDECIDADWRSGMYILYPKSTHRMDIWHDFDEVYAEWGGVAVLSGARNPIADEYLDWGFEDADSNHVWQWHDMWLLTHNVEVCQMLVDAVIREKPTSHVWDFANDLLDKWDEEDTVKCLSDFRYEPAIR